MKTGRIALLIIASALPLSLQADDLTANGYVDDSTIAAQRDVLARITAGIGFGPQSPRDIDSATGTNQRLFATAPDYEDMNLCNIHFHKHAEHKGGEFTTYAGNGDGQGYGTGYRYSGTLSESEQAPVDAAICPTGKDSLVPGDTIELHYVHTTANIEPGPTLGACLSDSIVNPQLRVEAQVYVLVNDSSARDFGELTSVGVVDGYHQAINIPDDTGEPVEYAGSTTGPAYNENGSPLQVSWSVRPDVARVNIESVGAWCDDNIFDETGGHGVRNLVVNPDLLSEIDS